MRATLPTASPWDWWGSAARSPVAKPDSYFGLDIRGTENSWAAFSADGSRRYVLVRVWDPDSLPMIFAMCNPSKADESQNDATIRKCIGFARLRWRGAIVVVNASPVVSTDPKGLTRTENICDDLNLEVLRSVFAVPADRVAAWGACPRQLARRLSKGVLAIRQFGHPLMCLGFTKDGEPHHPSRIAYKTPLIWLANRKPVSDAEATP